MESLIDRILFLQKVPIFKDLTVEELGHIASISESLEYEEGEYVFKEGDVGYDAYVIISGSIEIFRKISNKGKIVISRMYSGNYFGEMAIFDGDLRSASVITLETSILLSYKKEDMEDIILKYPSIGMGIIKIMSKRIREIDAKLKEHQQILNEFKKFSNKIDKMLNIENSIKGKPII